MTDPAVARTRRNAIVLGSTATVVGLLFLYPTSTGTSTGSATPAAPAGVVSTAPAPGGRKGATTTVVNGASVGTRYGPVQVRLTVRSGRIVTAKAIDYPQSSGRDQEINSYAIPELERETVATQNARIDTVSGATYTSDGYRRSLQSALDAAHLH
ncbi:MAG TPA: FMN-binding protein [Kribbella sp.]|nr:FMN-binding protein [Kribbella sp.]